MRFLKAVVISICLLSSIPWSQATFKPSLLAIDTPGDGGESIDLRWEQSPHGNLLIMRSFYPDQDFSVIAEIESSLRKFRDNCVKRGGRYYPLASISGEDTVLSEITGPAVPEATILERQEPMPWLQ